MNSNSNKIQIAASHDSFDRCTVPPIGAKDLIEICRYAGQPLLDVMMKVDNLNGFSQLGINSRRIMYGQRSVFVQQAKTELNIPPR